MKRKAKIWSPRPGIWAAFVEDTIHVALREPFRAGKLFATWTEAMEYSLALVNHK